MELSAFAAQLADLTAPTSPDPAPTESEPGGEKLIQRLVAKLAGTTAEKIAARPASTTLGELQLSPLDLLELSLKVELATGVLAETHQWQETTTLSEAYGWATPAAAAPE